MIRSAAVTVVVLIAVGLWASGAVSVQHPTGYFSPVFAADGGSVFAVRRDVAAVTAGFGEEFFTGPAHVWLLRDGFSLVNIRLSDGRTTLLEAVPASPLEGGHLQAYRGSLFGTTQAHLRWADTEHLDYEVAVTRPEIPFSRTFVVRRAWTRALGQYVRTPTWQEAPVASGGDEPEQLHGDREVIAMPGDAGMPCGLAVLGRDGSASAVVQTEACRRKYSKGLAPALVSLSRRSAIEHAERVRGTYADLVARGRDARLPEGQAMLEAGRQMQRLGLYPKSTMLIAAGEDCAADASAVTISDEEFRLGLFPDIERAIAQPGGEVEKSMGAYIVHRDYGSSRALNALIDARQPSFLVRARGHCWRLTIHRP